MTMNQDEANQTQGDLGITPEDLNEEMKSMSVHGAGPALENWKQTREMIIENIAPVDFPSEADLSDKDTVTIKVQTVIVIRMLLRIMQDLGLGLRMMDGQLRCYLGTHWHRVDRTEMMPFLGEVAALMGVRKVVAEHHAFREHLVKQFDTTASLASPEVPAGKILINFQNCTLEIGSGERQERPFRKEDFLTYLLPFDYDPTAPCPKWNAFLEEVLPDEASQKVLAEGFGQAFTDLKLEKVMMLYGSGANGKSVIFEVIQAIFGPENITSYSLNNLGHEYCRAQIANVLLNFSSELSFGIGWDIFKKLASGEPIDARSPYQMPYTVRRYAKLIFNCNELPSKVEHTHAFFRRLLIIPFTKTIPESEQDVELAKKIIAEELPGVFNWILAGLDRLVAKKGFSQCDAADREVKAFMEESDSVALFMNDCGFEKSTGEHIRLGALHREYRTFCDDNLYRAVSNRTMRTRLTVLGYESNRINKGVVVFARQRTTDEKIIF